MLFVNLNAGIGKHQAALADAMYRLLGDQFVFIEFGSKGRQYGDFKDDTKGIDFYANRPYILKMYESEENERLAKDLILRADAVRTGGEPISLIAQRLKDNKLTFRSSERVFKGPFWKDLLRTYSFYKLYRSFANPNYRVLCQSAYLPNDLRLQGGLYREKCYKFAYFTDIPEIDIESVISQRRKDIVQIVWCARFIDWKHPELPLGLAKRLLKSGRKNFEILMIGADSTPLWQAIKKSVENSHLENYVILIGGMPNSQVLEKMRQSHIFIFTSDKGEGWGAVLNEAMGAGCACVASNEIGAVPFLLKNRENGLVFKSCSVESLFENVSYLYDNPEKRNEYSKKAYSTITTDWSADNAAKRLVQLSESIQAGEEITFDEGPCSKAYPTIKESIL